MDDIILTIFVIFILSLFFIGYFKKQNLLLIFAGIGFILIGVFLLQGFTYITGSTLTSNTSLLTTQDYTYAIWDSVLKIPLFVFLGLFGLFLIFSSLFDIYLNKKGGSANDDGEDSTI